MTNPVDVCGATPKPKTSLTTPPKPENNPYRCELHQGHSGYHYANRKTWKRND